MSVNPSYKHLDTKLKVGGLTVWQWAVAGLGCLGAIGYALYLHPLGLYFTIATAVYIAGVPLVVALMAAMFEFNLWAMARSAWRWKFTESRYLPGPGEETPGYVVEGPEEGAVKGPGRVAVEAMDERALWDY